MRSRRRGEEHYEQGDAAEIEQHNTTAVWFTLVCGYPTQNKGNAAEPRGSTLQGHEKSSPNILVDSIKHARMEQEALRRARPAPRALEHACSTRGS